MNSRFIISEDQHVVVCLIRSKGHLFKGIALCKDTDNPNLEIGKKLAQCRADFQIRKKDLSEIRLVRDYLKITINNLPKYHSKLWMNYYQDACRVEKIQLKHIKNLKNQIKNLCNGIII